jgi:hypothetical protein
MMMMLRTRVECSAKIAMTALHAWRSATGLLPDLDQARRIFLSLSAMHIFRSHAFNLARHRDRGGGGTMNGRRLEFSSAVRTRRSKIAFAAR